MAEILILKKRKDFVRVAQGFKMVSSSLILQAAQSLSIAPTPPKLGYTATKKIGKAHVRNRTKRRLRAAAREIFSNMALDNVEYVLIGRYNTASVDFKLLKTDMQVALKRINKLINKDKSDEKALNPAD